MAFDISHPVSYTLFLFDYSFADQRISIKKEWILNMEKTVLFIPLCLLIFTTSGCESILKKEYTKPYKFNSSEKLEVPPKSSGYLAEGSTVKVDTGEGDKKISVLEQFEQTKQALAASQEKIILLEKELENEKAAKTALKTELKELQSQLEIMKQLVIENKKLRKQLEEYQEPYEEKIKELTTELTKAQIEETKAKQELISLKIELLMQKKKQIQQEPK